MWLGRLVLCLLSLLINPLNAADYHKALIQADLKQQTFNARVIRIMDGDTMEVLYKDNPVKIRLAHIDCPEKRGSQPFGSNAKQALSALCFQQTVTVKGEKYDRYKRLIAIVINNRKQNVNQEMLRQGMAWHFKKYSTDVVYARLELEARKNKAGLWQDAHPVAPWEWRKPKSRRLYF